MMIRRAVIGRSPKRTVIRAAILAAICYGVFGHLLIPVRIRGRSMEPTYHDGSVNLIWAPRFWRSLPRRGDVVAIRLAGRGIMYLKRVVGLPGERVAFRDGVLLIDGVSVEEPYLELPSNWTREEVMVGDDELFVVGDNRSTPLELHEHGRVRRERILGGPVF